MASKYPDGDATTTQFGSAHMPGGVIDLRKPRVKTTGEAMDEIAKAPMYTAADLRFAQPLGDLVFVQPAQAAKRSKGGVILPDDQQPVPTEGIVVAVGPGQVTIQGVLVPTTLRVGDRVKFVAQAFGGMIRIEGIDGVERIVLPMREVDVFCRFGTAADETEDNSEHDDYVGKSFNTAAALRTE